MTINDEVRTNLEKICKIILEKSYSNFDSRTIRKILIMAFTINYGHLENKKYLYEDLIDINIWTKKDLYLWEGYICDSIEEDIKPLIKIKDLDK